MFVTILTYHFTYADALLLNEYNAVSSTKQLKNDGYDTHYGDIDGNGGEWIELVVVEDYLDLRSATLTIKKYGYKVAITATFPNLKEFAYLRKGSIITISELPTDISYSPMDINNPDWTINLNHNELENQIGSFQISSSLMDISIESVDGETLMQNSGEAVLGGGISSDEVFKLKKEPTPTIEPSDPAYGDDNDKQIISTFGSANQWIDSNDVTIHQNLNNLRNISESINTNVLLNEYDAVGENEKLKLDGNDTYFGQIDDNGGSWVELVILKDRTDLRNAEIRVYGKYSDTNFKATFPDTELFSKLRSGTILTISDTVATDLSYDPFNEQNPDWTININQSDLTLIEGTFLTDNLKLLVTISSGSGGVKILQKSGEGVFGDGIDNKEVFKLKSNPSFSITPDDSTYGDDNQKKALSTFGSPNHWKDGTLLIIQDFTTLRLIAKNHHFFKQKTSLLLNEYNAVGSNKYLKNSGSDSHFGTILGNGGSWIEMIVTRDYLNLQNATLKIHTNHVQTFSAKIPTLLPFAFLRKGTIITISNEPTDISYSPFAPNSDDWTLNINVSDLTNQNGSFDISDNNIDISIIDDSGSNILLSNSGEGISNPVVDDEEIYKLKSEPSIDVSPFDNSYGDDNDAMAISTFSSANQWTESNGTVTTQKLTIQKDKDLVEIDGIVTVDINNLTLSDAESLQYVAPNNSLWITDDDSHQVFEMDLATKEVKTVFNDEDFGSFAPDIQDQCQGGVGICDIESIAYNNDNDILYVFVGNAIGTPAVFKLTRAETNETFAIDDYKKLDNIEYPAAVFAGNDFLVSIGKNIYIYDFETNQVVGDSLYTIPASGQIIGLAYASNTLFITTSEHALIKVNWQTKELQTKFSMHDNGVYHPRGVEIINGKLYILEGVNATGGTITAPQGHPLKGSIHIYQTDLNGGATPIITLIGSSTQTVDLNSAYVEQGATATDVEDGNLSVITTGTVDTTTIGTYTITYTATDSDNNTATRYRTVNVVNPQSGNVINVPSDYATIREAVLNASDGDTIILDSGTHIENGEITITQNNLTIASKYHTTGDESYIASTIIKGNSDSDIHMFEGKRDNNESNSIRFIGLTVKDTGKFITFVYGDNNLVDHCVIKDIERDSVSFDYAATGSVTYCTIDNSGDDAIDVDTKKGKNGGDFEFAHNTITNSDDDGIEIHLWYYANKEPIEQTMNFKIHHNTISNSDNDAIQLIDFDKTQAKNGVSPTDAIDYLTNTNRTFEIYNNTMEDNGDVAIGAIFQSTNHQDSARPTSRHFEGAKMGEAISIHDNTFKNNSYHILGGDNMDVTNNNFENASVVAVKRVKGDSTIQGNTFTGNNQDFEDSNN
jgi:hypothetical protein